MSIPVPIVECEGCKRRFGLTPQAFVEDETLESVKLLCHRCRDDDGEPTENWWQSGGFAAS